MPGPLPPMPPNEADRLTALRSYDIVDTPAESAYDDYTRLASLICGTPMALISFVDADRQWFKSRLGIEKTETPRNDAFCAHAIVEDEVMVVPDATADPRFAENPNVVGDPNIRFYAGIPLRTQDGHGLGVLCVLDFAPRGLSSNQRLALEALGRQLMAQLELRRTLAALAEQRAFSQMMFDSSLEGLAVLGSDGAIERVNPAIVEIFGQSGDALRGQKVEALLAHPNYYGPNGPLRDQLRAAVGRVTEWQGRRASGEVFPLEAQVWAFGPPHRRKLACHIRDVSQQREADRVKKQFVANVSHELRTPLTSIRGALALVLEGGVADDEPRQLLTVAHRNANRLLSLVNDLLDLERISSGQLAVAHGRCSLAAILERVAESTRPVARDADVTLSFPRTSIQLTADPDRLAQVLVNFVANGIRYSPRGDTVVVSADDTGGRVRITVDDQGPGVPAAYRVTIFEPFRQVEGSEAHKKGGTGLGLAISAAIVREHHGTIGVSDAPVGGARFWFEIPVSPDAAR